MAIKDQSCKESARSAPISGGKQEMTVEEFKDWLMTFDADNDGRISRKELRQAIRSRGMWFSWRKSSRGMDAADTNESGYIDGHELDNLLDFAEASLGFKFYR